MAIVRSYQVREQDAPRLTAGRRTKEIGIRKVFGASTRDLVILLLWQFSIPALIANAIAWPVAWYYLHGWLQGFAYRIALSPLYFLGAGTIAILIAWGTVFTHARQVAKLTMRRPYRDRLRWDVEGGGCWEKRRPMTRSQGRL